jgi:CRP-like cAMP-binding protein
MSAGATIMREGDAGDLFYVIAEGEVHVTKHGVEIARSGPGGYFGEIALLRDVPRTATVTAISDVRLLSLARRYFLEGVTGSTSSGGGGRRSRSPPSPAGRSRTTPDASGLHLPWVFARVGKDVGPLRIPAHPRGVIGPFRG